MMEVSEEPADAYVGAYAIVCGIAAILAGVFGGLVCTVSQRPPSIKQIRF